MDVSMPNVGSDVVAFGPHIRLDMDAVMPNIELYLDLKYYYISLKRDIYLT